MTDQEKKKTTKIANQDDKSRGKEKIGELEQKYKRALADYQNLLKRTTIEKQEFAKYANEKLLYEILPVYDNLKLALKHADAAPDNSDGIIQGVRHVVSQFKSVLENFGIREIKTIGEKFDHHAMEAIEKKETFDKEKDGTVADEIMAGYKLGDRVVRAAKVIVYKYKK